MKKSILRRTVSIVISALMLISVFSVTAFAQEEISRFEKDGFTYICGDDDDAHIINYRMGTSTTVNIPETVTYRDKEYTVKSIATGAFYIIDGNYTLERVNIPKTVESIDGTAFKDCYNLKYVNIDFGSQLTEIGYEAFSGCGSLTSFSIPSTVTTIGDEAFAFTLLDEITFPASLESLGDQVLKPAYIMGQDLKPNYISYYGTRTQWNALLEGKSIGDGLENTPVYVKATLTFDNMGHGANIGAKSFGPHYKPSMDPAIRTSGPVLSEDDYVFMGWYEDKKFTKRFDFSNCLTDDVTVYARWFKLSRTITYKIINGTWEDGTRDSIEVNIPSGQFTYYIPENMIPDRGYGNGTWGNTLDSNPYIAYPNDGKEFVYTFTPLTLYTVKWLNDDGSVLYSDTYYEGESEPTCDLIPEKEEDVQYTYIFEEWDYGTVDSTVKTYKPIFTDKEKTMHTVIWLNDDGTNFAVKTYFEGQDEPTISGSPKKASDLDYDYSFKKWDEGTVFDTVKTYRPIFNKTERPVYRIFVGYGKADVTESKQGKLITLTPDEPDEGMRFTGWKVMSGNITIDNNTFVMPAENVELYATYDLKKNVDVDFEFSDNKGYVGKYFTVEGGIKENGAVLDVGGTMTITFSSGSPDAEGAVSYTVPVNNGKYNLVVPSLTAGDKYVWFEYSGYGEYGEALVSDYIRVYDVSFAMLDEALTEEEIQLEYNVGEELNTDRLYITLLWMDGTEEYIPVTADMVSGFDSSKKGRQTLTVVCPYPTGDELTYEINVVNKYRLSNGGSVNLDGWFSRDEDDKTEFGIGNSFKNLQILGVQKKESGNGNNIRFVAAVNNEVLQDADDYGFIAIGSSSLDKVRSAAQKITFGKVSRTFSCKGKNNFVSGDYGKYASDKGYKYVTFAVNNIGENAVGVRFYVKKDNRVYYADYIDDNNTELNCCAANLAALS